MREKLLVFLIYSKQQFSQCERELFCIVDSQQMGVISNTCIDHKVSATVVRHLNNCDGNRIVQG